VIQVAVIGDKRAYELLELLFRHFRFQECTVAQRLEA